MSSLPFSRLICAKRRSRSPRFATSPCTLVTFLPISFTAAANSGSRRPVMKTYAPSFTNCLAVARPMPLLPPVMSASFPSSLPMYFSLGEARRSSDRWYGAAIYHVFAPVNRGCPVRNQEGDQFRDLFGPARPADGNSSERVHQPLAGSVLIGPGLFGEPDDEAMCSRRFDVARRNRIHADALRPNFLRQPLPLGRQPRLGGRIGERRLEQWQAPLDGRDMDDDARSLPQHSWQQSAFEADGGEEVGIDGVLPIRVAQSQHAAPRCGRTAHN